MQVTKKVAKMLQSILHKSKSLLGIRVAASNNVEIAVDATPRAEMTDEELKDTIYDLIRNIRDPEKPATLEDLNVVYEDCIMIKPRTSSDVNVVRIEFNPTVPHCSLATLIGLCIRVKLERSLIEKIKLDIYIKKGAHSTEEEINKQINDKERIAAAMENPNLRSIVETCILEKD